MSDNRAIPASVRVGLPQAQGELPPVPGSQSIAAPVITEAQRKRKGEPIDHSHPATKVVGYIALVLTVLMILVPLYFIFITSFKSFQDVYSDPISFWPNPFKAENYSYVWQLSLIHI